MGNKVSACLYIDRRVLETAKHLGLNISKVSENALREAVWRLGARNLETAPISHWNVRAEAGI